MAPRSPPSLSSPATGEAGHLAASVECSGVKRGGGSSWLNTVTDERSLLTRPSRVAPAFESLDKPLAPLADGAVCGGNSGAKALRGCSADGAPLPDGFSLTFVRWTKSRIGGCCHSQPPRSHRPARQIANWKMRLTVGGGGRLVQRHAPAVRVLGDKVEQG